MTKLRRREQLRGLPPPWEWFLFADWSATTQRNLLWCLASVCLLQRMWPLQCFYSSAWAWCPGLNPNHRIQKRSWKLWHLRIPYTSFTTAEATYSRCVPDAQSSSQGLHSKNDETALHSSKDMQPKSPAFNNLHATHDTGVQVLRGSAPAWCSQLLDTGVDDEYYSAHAEASYHSTDHRSRAIWGGELVITVLIFKPVKIWII